ncbi:hypothetical protein FACS1894199_17890 [Bacteroidia bacterium]|nr:hypothetical protein FACS1894199_17890 [Bacteroidia bacterium]
MEFANKEEIQYLQSLTEQTSLNFLLKEKAFNKKISEDCKYLIAMSTCHGRSNSAQPPIEACTRENC